MNAIDVMRILGEMGVLYRESTFDSVLLYFINMIKDERVVIISEDNKPYSVIAYSMTDNYEPFLKKGSWDYLPHNSSGHIVYVEKLVSLGWNKQVRIMFEHIIRTKYPTMEYGMWHRFARWGDRPVITKRRIINV